MFRKQIGRGQRFGKYSLVKKSRPRRSQFCDVSKFINRATPILEAKPYVVVNSFSSFSINERLKKNILIASLLFMILFIQTSSSLNATSSSYSFSMFGNGIATGRGDSNNYNSTFLSETGGTTRNAESSSFRANIGFFEESVYLRTVSISSYSISPKSAVVGSTWIS